MARSLRNAFRQTIPVLLGYCVMGIAFGLLLQRTGYGWPWALGISSFVYAGSMQFVLINFLGSSVGLVSVALMTLSVNSRHIFYGLSFLEAFRAMGKAYPYMIFSLTDETYSLLCGASQPDGVERNRTFLCIAILNHSYWILGSLAGSLLGEILTFDTTGIDFAMTALFVVIFVDQWQAAKHHFPALLGLGCGVGCLLLLGASQFILPSLLLTVGGLMIWRKLRPFSEEEAM